jgi:hypothetical protein
LITEWSCVDKVDAKVFCCKNCSNAFTRAQTAPEETPIPMPPRI